MPAASSKSESEFCDWQNKTRREEDCESGRPRRRKAEREQTSGIILAVVLLLLETGVVGVVGVAGVGLLSFRLCRSERKKERKRSGHVERKQTEHTTQYLSLQGGRYRHKRRCRRGRLEGRLERGRGIKNKERQGPVRPEKQQHKERDTYHYLPAAGAGAAVMT